MSTQDSAHQRNRLRRRYSEGPDGAGGDGCGCGCNQFLACMMKHIHQKRRDVVASLLEFFLPILFVVGSVILWGVFGNTVFPASQFVNYTAPGPLATPATSFDAFARTICVNMTHNPNGINGIAACNFSASTRFTCYRDDPTVPVTGLCSMYTNPMLSPTTFLGLLAVGTTTLMLYPLRLDDIILMQWIARHTLGQARQFYSALMSITTSGKLYFAPNTAETQGLVQYMNSTSNLFRYVYGATASTPAEAEAFVTNLDNEGKNWGIINVLNLSVSSFNVELRLNHSTLPMTNQVINQFYLGGVQPDNSLYYLSGFYTLQWVISQYFLNNVATVGYNVTAPMVVAMGYAEYDEQAFLSFGGAVIPLLIVLGFLYPVSQLAKRIVQEKELRIREAMQIMGLGNSAFYGAWIATYFVQHVVISIVITIILKNTYLTRSNSGILFFTFFFFEMSTISMAGLISAFFSKARLAAIVSPLIYFATSIPLFVIGTASANTRRQLLILSPTAFANGIQLLFQHELGGGMSAENLRDIHDDPSMITVLIMLAIDTIVYFLLWIYVDSVMPNDWGTPKFVCYCITDPIKTLYEMLCSAAGKDPVSKSTDLPDGRCVTGVFEDAPVDEGVTVQIIGLRKEFERGGKTFTAVNNLYWQMHEGEISVLLGHNGAGKTTTINLITGMMQADGGDAYVYGYSVRDELDMVRREIGFCPQHNVLWPELTCEEHLRFYANIKGITGQACEDAITRMLTAVDLLDKREYLTSAISGGQKRKLSVAIAFVGGSRLIFLDEPTAGMDVGARRHTWELLKRMASNHTILLTTHFMDEADLLGHTIGIMSQGSLQCSGSSLFLKSRLGVGYNVVLGVEHHVDVNRVDQEVRSRIPAAQLVSNGAGEITYRLPTSSSSIFPSLFSVLEQHGPSFGVRNFSVSATTLEEIFLQIAHGADMTNTIAPTTTVQGSPSGAVDNEADTLRLLPRREESATNVEMQPVSAGTVVGAAARAESPSGVNKATLRLDVPSDTDDGKNLSSVWNVRRLDPDSSALFFSQLEATLTKRFKNSLRDRRTQCLQIVTPVVCILLAMLFTLIKVFNDASLVVDSSMYKETVLIDTQGCETMFNLNLPIAGALVRHPSGLTNALNLSNYLMNTADYHGGSPRYSGIACDDAELSLAVGVNHSSLVFYNTSTFHEISVGVYNFFNSVYRRTYGSGVSMTLTNHPMPQTPREAALADSIKSMLIGMIIMIPFTFIPSTFVAWVVKERECKARHLQNVSGLQFATYWLSNFIFDMMSFCVTVFLAIIVFLIFNRTEYIGGDTIGATIVLFFFYGVTGIAFAYACSFFFEEHSTAQNIVMLANFIAGFLLVLVVFILNLVPATKNASVVLSYIFRIVPSYALGDGIINLALLQVKQTFGTKETPWTMGVCGSDIAYMAVEFPFMMLLTLFIDHPKRRMKTQALLHNPDAPPVAVEGEEDDVARERREVENPQDYHRDTDLVLVTNLRKEYNNGKVAVKNLSFGVHPGEVFGFLGTNGAGKTTTISILCQEHYPSSGHGYIAGYDIVTHAEEALRCIGYCPQFDALLDLLTVEEHLFLYAGIRGIVAEDREKVVRGLAKLCELTAYMPTLSCELSGGNKRKLSVALSLIGGPRVVFLDEPSAGMDPMARRGLWTAIETVADNCSVVLTTHHLEEVEALANRVAIMVDGTLRCIGDKLHLKTKYGSGFELSLKLHDEGSREALHEFMTTNIPLAKLDESRGLRFTYALPTNTKLSEMFGLMEKHKDSLSVTDYSISQTSIEQVFLRISGEAEQEEDDARLQTTS